MDGWAISVGLYKQYADPKKLVVSSIAVGYMVSMLPSYCGEVATSTI